MHWKWNVEIVCSTSCIKFKEEFKKFLFNNERIPWDVRWWVDGTDPSCEREWCGPWIRGQSDQSRATVTRLAGTDRFETGTDRHTSEFKMSPENISHYWRVWASCDGDPCWAFATFHPVQIRNKCSSFQDLTGPGQQMTKQTDTTFRIAEELEVFFFFFFLNMYEVNNKSKNNDSIMSSFIIQK